MIYKSGSVHDDFLLSYHDREAFGRGVESKHIGLTERRRTPNRPGDMSQHNGAPSSLASIEAAPPAHGTLRTTTTTATTTATTASSDSLSSTSSLRTSLEPLSVQSSVNLNPSSSTPSRRVQIPRLSAATTELLARVTGSIKGAQRNDNNFFAWNPPAATRTFSNQNIHRTGTMRASSTIIELPTAPFVYSNSMAPPAVPKVAATMPPAPPAKPTTLANIVPRPTETPPAVAAPPPPPLPLPPVTRPQSTAPAAKTSSPATAPTKPKKPAAAGSRQRKSITTGGKRGKKRRRNNDSDGEDVIRAGDSSTDESDVAPTATQTKSGRHVNRPSLYVPPPSAPAVVKETSHPLDTSDNVNGQAGARKRKRIHRRGKDAIITCLHCQRGNSPLSNSIVLCDECNAAWHQLCHDPPIGAEVVSVKDKEWFCRECRPVQVSIIQPTVVRSNPTLTSEFQARSHPPLLVPKAEVGADEYADDDRRGFLSGLSHATLVELLMTISDSNPTVPMFPGNLRELQPSKFSFRQSISTVPTPSTSGPGTAQTSTDTRDSASVEEANKQHGDTTSGVAGSSSRRRRAVSEDDSEYEFQEHRLYPRAGNGFRLSLNVNDLDILGEDPACPTFSYSLHGPAQLRAQMNESIPVWSS
ncbi:hypothetical protein BO71DRAFT_435971 [Aspergillus ellipticus CBS 707.79]|uniref:PHD-type domain-containing protein n=1 Tax=Aspergillus ellipticus CBS 707.79 TaxID=1448320 RepID=A0A319DB18_9EURO|nr:hypothetical protein BO71DRAFT_435971 [Aspergillus ellipticus CBS 707.79]